MLFEALLGRLEIRLCLKFIGVEVSLKPGGLHFQLCRLNRTLVV
jgi:hypothetical protein